MIGLLVAELVVGALAAGVFVVRYLRVAGWWRSTAGRHMMGLTAVLAAFLGLLGIEAVASVSLTVWAVVLGVLDVSLIGQVYLLYRAQNGGKNGQTDQPTGGR